MMRRRSARPVKGDEPPTVLPTVWEGWSPATDGPTVRALRRYLERMDEHRAEEVVDPKDLALLMYDVYVTATEERLREATGSAG
jgi:hypothetical protein